MTQADRWQLASTPVGPEIVALDERTRETLVAEVSEALAPNRG